jgi:hypothetical protein
MNKTQNTFPLNTKRFLVAFLILSALLTMMAPQTFGHNEKGEIPPRIKNYAVTLEPSHLLFGGLRFGFDMRIQDKNWIQIKQTIYLLPAAVSSYNWDWYDDEFYYNEYNYGSQRFTIHNMYGFGIGANYKRYFSHREFLYCLAGFDYSFQHVNGYNYDYIPFMEDGNTYYRFGKSEQTQNFNNVGVSACIGINTTLRHHFFVDVFLGVGAKYAFYNKNKPALDDEIFDYGYRGFYPVFGFRLGGAF